MDEATDAAFYDDIRAAFSLLDESNTGDVVDRMRDLLRRDPNRAEPFYILGLAAAQLGDVGRAATLIEHAHEIDPECKEYADVLAVIYTRVGRLTEGMYFAKLATALEPHAHLTNLISPSLGTYFDALNLVEPPHHFVHAMIAANQRKFARAVELSGMALRVDPKQADCHALAGRCLGEMGEHGRAAAAFHSAIHIEPHVASHYIGLGNSLCHQGQFQEAWECYAKALAVDANSVEAAAGAVQGRRFAAAAWWRDRDVLEDELQRRFRAHPAVASPELLQSVPPPATDKIRIGYIGNRFHEGPDAAFFVPLIAGHDRNRVEVFCYQQSVTQHDVVFDLQLRVDGWREIYDLDPEVVASIIQSDGIDALIDLGGYTEGNPLLALAIKPARIQVGWLNHLDGTGSETTNLILSDPVTEATDRANLRPGQECLTIESGLFALEPYFLMPAVGELPGRSSGSVTFGGRADLARVTPEVVHVWSDVLDVVPNSNFLLGGVRYRADEARARFTEMFAHFGVSDRVFFHEADPELLVDPDFFASIDVMLDTFPVAGTEETCQALWMGVPVVTLNGDRRCAQLGASILRSAGRAGWVAATAAEFVSLAAKLAADLGALADVRAKLRSSLESSNLFNPTALARSIEGGLALVLRSKKVAEAKALGPAAAGASKAATARKKAAPASKGKAKAPRVAGAKGKPKSDPRKRRRG